MTDQNKSGGAQDRDQDADPQQAPNSPVADEDMEEKSGAGYGNNAGQQGAVDGSEE